MPEPDPDPERPKPRVSADRPVNLRTAKIDARPVSTAKLTPHLKARLDRMSAQSRLGVPLAQELRALSSATSPSHNARLMSYMAIAAGGVGALLGLILLQPPLSYAVAAPLAALGVAAAVHALRLSRRDSSTQPQWPTGLDAEAVEALDDAMERVAGALEPAHLPSLRNLKSSLISVAAAARSASPMHWSAEDQAWLVQCVRRYLPDTLQAYLDIPAAHRGDPLPGGQTNAHQLLQSQLESLQRTLDKLQAKLFADRSERLLMQQRFLSEKEKGH